MRSVHPLPHNYTFCSLLWVFVSLCCCGKTRVVGDWDANLHAKQRVFTRDPPVAVAGHLSHDLAVDFILQGVVLGGRAKDLVSQLYRIASVMGVVAHVPQDRWQEKVKEFSGILNDIFKRRSFHHGARVNVGKEAKGKKRLKILRPKRCQVVDLTGGFMKNNGS